MLVTLFAPVIGHRHLFCNVVSLATGPRPLVLVSFVERHIAVLYVIAGRTTAVYTCLALFNVTSHAEATILVYTIGCEICFA